MNNQSSSSPGSQNAQEPIYTFHPRQKETLEDDQENM